MTGMTRDGELRESTRERLLKCARQLFTMHSFAGTSLQMIADKLGLTKAAVYHHFKTRDEILNAVVEPAIDEVNALFERAEKLRGHHARAEAMITGFAELTVKHRDLITLMSVDPGVVSVLEQRGDFGELIYRPLNLLVRDPKDPVERIRANAVMACMATTAPSIMLEDIDRDTLRDTLIDIGFRILGLRRRR